MTDPSSRDLDSAAHLRALQKRIRKLEFVLAAIFVGIGVLAGRAFNDVPHLTLLQAMAGGACASLVLVLLYWHEPAVVWLQQRGVPRVWSRRLVVGTTGVGLVYCVPAVIMWFFLK